MHKVLPSPSAQSGIPYLRKRSRSPWFRLPASSAVLLPWGPHSAKAAWSSLPSPPKPRGPLSGTAACLGFKSQHQSSSAAPFPTPPTISHTWQHSCILSALPGYHSKPGQVWPPGMEPIFSKLSCRRCNQGELLPSYILDRSHSHLPGSKHGHSYLTYPWNQLKVIDMLNDHAEVSCTAVAMQNSSEKLLHVSLPPAQACGGEDILYIFF